MQVATLSFFDFRASCVFRFSHFGFTIWPVSSLSSSYEQGIPPDIS